VPRLEWQNHEGGVTEIGYSPNADNPLDFSFDNETPRHRVYQQPFQIAKRSLTCREYLEFMSDDGYTRPGLWLSDGWELGKQSRWEAPLYWERDADDETGWRIFTLRGSHGLSDLLDTAVCHISFYEADAFARWRDCRLPTEAEWESIASQEPLLMRVGYILQWRVGPRASSICLATAGNGQQVPTRAIPDTNLFRVLWANTTANSCLAR
jgi:formylglycine-generating enzyme required for sulfatase activity